MTDLTKIEKPFGLLDAETQAALKAHGGPWEHYFNGTWLDAAPNWVKFPILGHAYRVKSAAPKPREVTGVWNRHRHRFEIYVTNVDYEHGFTLPFTVTLP